MPMEFWTENLIMYVLIAICFGFSILGMAGNLWMLFLAAGYAVYTDFNRYPPKLLLMLFLVFLLGEAWDFVVGFFGVKRKNVPWSAVFLIGVGSVLGVIAGTMFLPVLGSFVGGAVGASLVGYLYEYHQTKDKENAKRLAWLAFKVQFLASAGKIAVGLIMALMQIMYLKW